MRKTMFINRTLAVTGTVLAWFPILITVVISIAGTISEGVFLFDYLMPAELFLVALAGGLLLFWASMRTCLFRRAVIIGLAAMCVFLAVCQIIALLSGLAHGMAQPEGLAWILVLVSLALYVLAMIELGVVGIELARRLYTGGSGEE